MLEGKLETFLGEIPREGADAGGDAPSAQGGTLPPEPWAHSYRNIDQGLLELLVQRASSQIP